MNMNKIVKILIFGLLIFVFLNNKNVYADDVCSSFAVESQCIIQSQCKWDGSACVHKSTSLDVCKSFSDEKHCLAYGQCKWNGSSCQATFVAEDACDENAIRKVLQFFGYLLLIARVAVPLLIIGFATFDLFKAVIDKDEKSFGKQVKSIIIRVVSGLIVFFVPSFIYAIFSLSDKLDVVDTSQYQTCANCLLKPTKCVVED